jgi:phosphoglycolate phosphatase
MFLNSIPWHHHTFNAALVDLDGTLVDTVGDFVLALQGMVDELPLPFSRYVVQPSVVRTLVGKGSEVLIKSLLSHIYIAQAAINTVASDLPLNHLEELAAPAFAIYQRHYSRINGQQSTVYPGVIAGLECMREAGWRLACVTNKPTALAEELLRLKGLNRFFEFTLGGDALPRKKPDPLPLLHACRRLGTEPARTLMVGDSSNDAQAAREALCPVLLVRYGYNHGEPIEAVDADAFTDALDAFMVSIQG